MEVIRNAKNQSGVFVQVGAGCGDLDARANYRDGFTEFVKSLPRERIQKIILVEPNPVNIPLLRECWKDYPEAIIHQVGIVPRGREGYLNLYYCPADAPHYQVASINRAHVEKHYGENCAIEIHRIQTITLESLLGNDNVELLCLDIEGIDADVLLDMDFSKINVKYLSFEHIHLGEQETNVMQHLVRNNYFHIGSGADHNGFDYLFELN
jgi:FkbM family methyltransferase